MTPPGAEEQATSVRRDSRVRQRALFSTLLLVVVLIGLWGHEFFTSPRRQAKLIMQDASQRPAARAFRQLGCRIAYAMTPAEVAMTSHFHAQARRIPNVAPDRPSTDHVAVCIGGKAPCEELRLAYRQAGGAEPVVVHRSNQDDYEICTARPPANAGVRVE